MGATEILKLLNKKSDLTSVEIAEFINVSLNSTQKAISRLLKDVSENVEFRNLTEEEKIDKYGHKVNIKVRVYRLGE